MMSTSSKSRTEVGEALSASLASRGASQNSVAKALGVSQGYVSQTISGEKLPSAQWLDMVATVLDLRPDERVNLHRAAARSHGFKIDLT